jgi:hypothetical protein
MKALRSSRAAARRFTLRVAPFALAVAGLGHLDARAGVNVSGGGLLLIEEGGQFADNNVASSFAGAVPFALDSLEDVLGPGVHSISYLNDGWYGNANSWIGNGAASGAGPFAGVALDGSFSLSSIAFGRSNVREGDPCAGGVCTDRSLGLYRLQYTNAANPSALTDDSLWNDIGTIEYTPGAPGGIGPQAYTASHLRHRFNFNPVNATGVRLVNPDFGTAIDEIELYTTPGLVLPPHIPRMELAETGGTFAPNNLAAQGTPFALDELAFEGTTHFISDLNDQAYGNADAWIGNGAVIFDLSSEFDLRAFAGISLGNSAKTVRSIAWGRDNLGTFTDRANGQYVVQYTTTPNPDAFTPESAWTTIEEVTYGDDYPLLNATRHRFNFAPVSATGMRIIVPATGIAGGTALDEIEIYEQAGEVSGPPPALKVTPSVGYAMSWDGNDGDFNDPNDPALAPDNLAINTRGAVAIGSTELGFDTHFIDRVNDGLYGNSRSWIADFVNGDADPFIGVAFDGEIELNALAFGRDNGNTLTDACGGTCMDRALGTYTLQVTRVDDPNAATQETGDAETGWVTVGEVKYNFQDDTFTPWLRHEFSLTTAGGEAISATGLRIMVSDPNIAIDEIEVYLRELAQAGDTNGDGVVDLVDLNNVRNNFGGTGLGDTAPFDGVVNLEDLNAVRNNFGAGNPVPEPATWALALLGLPALLWRRCRK